MDDDYRTALYKQRLQRIKLERRHLGPAGERCPRRGSAVETLPPGVVAVGARWSTFLTYPGGGWCFGR
jgi:hypothetical protein